jgi:DNA invertase Pin-like site-specific DNA recombinase
LILLALLNVKVRCKSTGEKQVTVYGYARVSTDHQTLAQQDAAIRAAGAAKTFSEKISGAKADRVELNKLLRRLEPGDLVLVTRLDRMARSVRDLLNVLDMIAKAGASFKSLNDEWANTDTPHGRLMLHILAGLAEFERSLISSRTSAGREDARSRGVKFGRPRKLTPHQRSEALKRRAAGERQSDIARSYNVDASMISRL